MDLHTRYLHSRTLDIFNLPPDNGNTKPLLNIHSLIELYNHEIIKETMDTNKLEICFRLLCYEYQHVFKDIENRGNTNKTYIIPEDAKKTRFSCLRAIFPPQYSRSTLECSILRDIIILQIALYYDIESIVDLLLNFVEDAMDYYKYDSKVTHIMIIEYTLESIYLHQFLHNIVSSSHYEESLNQLSMMYWPMLNLWLQKPASNEWILFSSTFLMLTKAFAPEKGLFLIWDKFMNECGSEKKVVDNSETFFTALSIIADTCFPSDSMDPTPIHCYIYTNYSFWIKIMLGLQSPVQQNRKQSIYIMKKAVDSLIKIDVQKFVNLNLTKASSTPFICNEAHDNKALSLDHMKQLFFLILETLQESQYHLVAPVFTHIASLVEMYTKHNSCEEGSDMIIWIIFIFESVLQHENNNVIKWCILFVCKLEEVDLFNDKFLELFVNTLNNHAFLYECHSNEECPEIVKGLATFFKFACMKDEQLLNKFLKLISKKTWYSVAIFYIIHTLQTVLSEKKQHNWQVTELKAIETLAETLLKLQSHTLRTVSQIELLKVIPYYLQKIDDLVLLANTIAACTTEENFIRGTVHWNLITTWLQKVLTIEDAEYFVNCTCEKYWRADVNINSEINPKTFALIVYLLCDANLILSRKICSTKKILNCWLSTLNDITLRPYAHFDSMIDVIEFISHLLKLSEIKPDAIADLIRPHLYTTFNILIQNMKKISTKATYEDYQRYTYFVHSHISKANLLIPKRDVNKYVEQLQHESVLLLKDMIERANIPNGQFLYGLNVLHLSQNTLVTSFARNFYEEYLLNNVNPDNYLPFSINDTDTSNFKGIIASTYYQFLIKLLYQYIAKSSTPIQVSKILFNLEKFLELDGSYDIVPEIATILTLIIEKEVISDLSDKHILENIFQICWIYTLDNFKSQTFWFTIEKLTGIIINDNFMLLSKSTDFITNCIDQLLEVAKNAPRFYRILLFKMGTLKESNLINLAKIIFNCLFYGSVRHDKKAEYHAYLYITKHLEHCFTKNSLVLDHSNDAIVKAQAVILIYKIISHPELNFTAIIVAFILKTLEKHKNKRYFKDSNVHKLKQRLMQMLLILAPILSEELVAQLQEKICDLILLESNQHSVRLMQEWFLILIFEKNINLHNKLWEYFEESITKRPGCTVSLISIVYHIARLLSNDNQKSFIQKALPYLVQCCLGQQFKMRLYSQFILVRLYDLMKETYGDDSVLDYKSIYQAAMVNLQQGNLMKNSVKIQDDFYFTCFHPINDYTLQSIYFEFPRLTDVNFEEWVSPEMFQIAMFKQNDNHPLQLWNINSTLSEAKISMYFTKSPADNTESMNNDQIDFEDLHDIQKKISPLKPTTSLYSHTFESIEILMDQEILQEDNEGLIVIASFVTRLPNLGGIARTCEIFGVKALVVANLNCLKDKEFVRLSVSAENWINIMQVKPEELQEYFKQKKDRGWSIIGVEQTANSTNLLQTNFEKKTILVLGNEDSGVPANFIKLFDKCVTIPQAGVIRSLNVHVTAAICIWQYACQHTLK